MGNKRDYPDSPYEFIKEHEFKDSLEVYTNSTTLIPVSRVKELIEHYFKVYETDY